MKQLAHQPDYLSEVEILDLFGGESPRGLSTRGLDASHKQYRYVDILCETFDMPYMNLLSQWLEKSPPIGRPNLPPIPAGPRIRHLLTTGKPDLYFLIQFGSDCIDAASFSQFSFLLPFQKSIELDMWPHLAKRAYDDRFARWVIGSRESDKNPEVEMWLLAREMCPAEPIRWIDKKQSDFDEQHPGLRPTVRERTSDWKSWPDDDPAKPYIQHAVEAMQILLNGNPDGALARVDPADRRGSAMPRRRSGVPNVASLEKANANLYSQLHGLIGELGSGDLEAGMKAILQQRQSILKRKDTA